MNEIRVLIVDDQTLMRQGLKILLELESDLRVVGEASEGVAALAEVESRKPDVVLMDVRMPRMNGVDATRAIRAKFPHTQVIILTTFDDDEYVFDGLRAGAMGYLLKDADAQVLADAIRRVARGEALIQPSIARKVVGEFARMGARAPTSAQIQNVEELSEREIEIVRLIATGLSNREIADKLFITEGTVKNHVTNILGKLGVRDRTQAALRAREMGLI
ncbi:MAG: response regulator transcription factor [Chloroflexi bacterium]|nr:response regulator transcription factor [Chloroflexota bacterium]